MMFPENEAGSAPQVAAPDALPAAPAAPAPESAPSEQPTQAVKETQTPTPELTLREKIQKKADEVASRHQKDPVTGKFLAKKPELVPLPNPENPAQRAVKTPPATVEKPVVAAPTAFTPNFKVRVDKQDRDIPEILRPLMKDAASEKEVRELCEKAFGLEFNKPRLERATTQLAQVSQEHNAVMGQIQVAQRQFRDGDIDGWLKTLAVPEERILQWVADKIEYSKLPQDQRAIIDQGKQAVERAASAEQQKAYFQQQHEQILSQQVQMALDSALARVEVDTVAKAYDARMGKPGAFKAEINRRGDYIWKTENKLTPPDELVQELMKILGPVSTPAPASTTAPVAAAPATPAPKVPTIPNISGRSTSALPAKVGSIADMKSRLKEIQAAKR